MTAHWQAEHKKSVGLAAPSTPLRLLQRQCACGGTPGLDGECAECRAKRLELQRLPLSSKETRPGGEVVPPIVHEALRSPGQGLDASTPAGMEPRPGHDFGQMRVHTDVPPGLQASLSVNQPGDEYEQQAERIAEQVMRMPEPHASLVEQTPSTQPLVQRSLPPPSPAPTRGGRSGVPPLVHDVLRSSGAPLDAATRAFMEPRFGYDFSRVRVHTDKKAAESVRAVRALAYTVGQDVVFGAGQYAPASVQGRKLLAHELSHVAQQTGGLGSAGSSTSVPALQRQLEPPGPPGPEPEFECKFDIFKREFECCAPVPGVGRTCAPDPVTIKKKIEEALKGLGKTSPDLCRGFTGFKPGGASEFKGQCCRGTESKENCCPPEQITANAAAPKCCPKDTIPDSEKKTCVTPPKFTLDPCPPDRPMPMGFCLCLPITRQNLKRGICCPVGQAGVSGECEEAKPKPPPPAPFTVVKTIEIEFKKDAPQTWYDPRASFSVSVTSEGKTHFNDLVSTMAGDPGLLVQLEGRASSDKPPGDGDYNRRLTDRRVQLIAAELKKMKIDPDTRASDPPGQTNPAECEEIATGLLSCGDAEAKVPVDPKDRKVAARVFSVAKQVTP